MTLEIKSCYDCPFCNNDNEFGSDRCNLASKLGKDINLLGNWEQLPQNNIHEDCPLKNRELLIKLSK